MEISNEITCLTKAEEETLLKLLFDFVQRVASPDGERTEAEVAILPEIARLLYDGFVMKI